MATAYHVDIIDFAATPLAGIVVRTNMQQAMTDCTALWESFWPRMPELSGKSADQFQGASFGLSVVVDFATGQFDYYACLPYSADKALPEGMKRLELPAGAYAKCVVPSLKDLTSVYNFMYEQWLPVQEAYAPNMQGISFERYDERYMSDGSLEVYIPLLKKA